MPTGTEWTREWDPDMEDLICLLKTPYGRVPSRAACPDESGTDAGNEMDAYQLREHRKSTTTMEFLKKSSTGMLASKTLTGHLVRGVVAFVLLYGAMDQLQAQPWLSLLAAVAALLVMRGCPVCWAIGLMETVAQRWAALRR